MVTCFSGGSKQLVNFITCGCESSAPFFNLQSRARTHAVLVIGLYELLGKSNYLTHWATRALDIDLYWPLLFFIFLNNIYLSFLFLCFDQKWKEQYREIKCFSCWTICIVPKLKKIKYFLEKGDILSSRQVSIYINIPPNPSPKKNKKLSTPPQIHLVIKF